VKRSLVDQRRGCRPGRHGFRRTVRKRGFFSSSQPSWLSSRSWREGGGGGRCRRLSRRAVLISGHCTILPFPLFPCLGSPPDTVRAGDPGYRDPVLHRNLMPFTSQEIEEEEAHFASVVSAFRNYTSHSVKPETIDRTLC
jgi:hypothetical protein